MEAFSMEIKQINQLMVSMGRYGITKLLLKKEGFEIELERGLSRAEISADIYGEESGENPLHSDFARRRAHALASHEPPAKPESAPEATKQPDESSLFVDAPMVGTIYLSPSPGEPAFVKVGDTVSEETVVCLVEAMKVMNEVKAGVRGVVSEVLVENAHPVEYGTRLFRIVSEK
jgi:acetyl-CoA carboxylase biotin carboxyl carrier protein